MPIIQIEQNNPDTLERIRREISKIATADEASLLHFRWSWCAGYLVALAQENLIDEGTKHELDAEANRARDEWKPAAPPSQLPEGGGFQRTVAPPPRY